MDDYIQCFRDGENIYYLNSKGRERVGSDNVRKKSGNVTHFIMRNYLYLAYNKPFNWKNEMRIKSQGMTKKDTITVVADAMFHVNGRWHIVEVDHTQTMKKNENKVSRYRNLINRKAFGNNPPKLIWITTTEYRRRQLKKICEGLETEILTISDFKGE